MRKTIVCVVGTRPEAIKMAPVILAIHNDGNFDVKVLATGQHADMLDSVLNFFNITPDTNLHVMKNCQGLEYITSSVLTLTSDYLKKVNPAAVLVHGDTTTTFAAALAAFYLKIPVGHVEAGLRSFTLTQPFPEELNRVLVDKFAKWAFAPTVLSKQNLIEEKFPVSNIVVTGNTVIDALLCAVQRIKKPEIDVFNRLSDDKPFVLLTAHRRESWGKPLEHICQAVAFLLENYSDLNFLVPMHKNPIVREVFYKYFTNEERVVLCEPLEYPDFVWAMKNSLFIMSDSGGVQEEVTAIKKPLLILRSVTERPEAIENGTGILTGTDDDKIIYFSRKLLDDKIYYDSVVAKCALMPFGDGTASQKIVEVLKESLCD